MSDQVETIKSKPASLEETKSAIVGQEKNLNFATELYNKKITSKKIKTRIIGSLYFLNILR